jgi:hypothetical protein
VPQRVDPTDGWLVVRRIGVQFWSVRTLLARVSVEGVSRLRTPPTSLVEGNPSPKFQTRSGQLKSGVRTLPTAWFAANGAMCWWPPPCAVTGTGSALPIRRRSEVK